MPSLTTLLTLSLVSTIQAWPIQERSTDATINWHPCPAVEAELREALPGVTIPLPFDCASLSVPLDYTNTSSPKLDLALIRVNATREPVLGSVLWNPGGPGGAGVENLAVQSDDLMKVLGGHYNIISWDPRGTGKTIPFNCKIAESSLQTRSETLMHTNLTERFLDSGWDESVLYADACYEAMNATGQFIGTVFAVRDMLKILDALGEDGQLRYWGPSYGSYLGATFAAMFPERVERMLLESVVNPRDYAVGHWGNYLVDADKTFAAFLDECEKNRDRCALARNSTDLLATVNEYLETLDKTNSASPYYLVKMQIYQHLYFPRTWPILAETLAGLVNGTLQPADLTPPPTQNPYDLGLDDINGIRCSDALWQADSAEDILDQVKYQANISSFSDTMYGHTWICAAWRMRAKERYRGNFKAKTNFPILFVNGEYDVATPMISAVNASAGFEGSVLLTHGGYGHVLTSHMSNCTNNAIQAYFADGVLPEPGTYCKPDAEVWDLS